MSTFHRFRSKFAALSLLLLASACDPEPSPPEATDPVLLQRQDTMFESAVRTDGLGDPIWHMRASAMVHLATHDAFNGIDAADPKADPNAAVASAAHSVLVALSADQA